MPASANRSAKDALCGFHPAVRTWFERRFEAGPTAAQALGWPPIARGEDTLIAAPTGSGKTLSAFLVCIDRFYQDARSAAHAAADSFALTGEPEVEAEPSLAGVEVIYVSPLKALAADIQANLSGPLAEIGDVARELGHPVPEIRVGMRSGDTPASARAGRCGAAPCRTIRLRPRRNSMSRTCPTRWAWWI